MRSLFVFLLASSAVLVSGDWLMAQSESTQHGVVQQLNSLDHRTLAVLLIFGTGLVATLCWGVGWIVSCSRGSHASEQSLRAEVEALGARVWALEQTVGSPASVGDASPLEH